MGKKITNQEISRRVRHWATSEQGKKEIEEGVFQGKKATESLRKTRTTVRPETWRKEITI